jgi:hypothetical protein
MGNYASGRNALAECDVCGFQYKLGQLKALVVKHRVTDTLACPECWNPDHPQNHLGEVRVLDPQAIRNPRPDFAGYAESRSITVPVTMPSLFASLGIVTVSTT